MGTADEVRAQQRQAWDGASTGWEHWDPVVMAMLAPARDEMVRLLAPSVTSTHLDVATGTGEPGLTIAGIAREGHVVLTDLAPRMLAAARRAADACGLTNVEVREASADALPFDDDTFDSVTCRFGLMFVPDVTATVRELVRVLRPGGRVCVAVWAEPAKNPWVTVPMGAIGSEIPMPPPAPDGPGIFRCAAPGAISSVFSALGLKQVTETEVGVVQATDSTDDHWAMTNEVSAPIAAAMAALDNETRQRVRTRMEEALRPFRTPEGVRLPGVARCVVGTK
jgi:SAM-dependent methyltransferase